MLVVDQRALSARVWFLMGDIAHQATSTKQALLELAKQVNALGEGLQHAAPSDKTDTPNPSIEYLLAMAEVLNELAVECDHVKDAGDTILSSKEKLLGVTQTALTQDESLRQQFNIANKFRFVREKLQALHDAVNAALASIQEAMEANEPVAAGADEVVVYVYLFNAQGVLVPTWRKMVTPSVMYEYSVNRPIYRDQSALDAIIRTKSERQQHAYFAIAVKKENIISDAQGHALVRVKEGCLSHQRILFFRHNEHDYRVSETGELIKLT
ncbi:MAG TPA: type IVB secretion system protein IcmQ [Gammaproteobacteria bacterium]|jgi:hypothetical protein|nr:type IVB secretion system protein IcmQ [Gammaproteobacteria bacterium]